MKDWRRWLFVPVPVLLLTECANLAEVIRRNKMFLSGTILILIMLGLFSALIRNYRRNRVLEGALATLGYAAIAVAEWFYLRWLWLPMIFGVLSLLATWALWGTWKAQKLS